MSYLKKHELFCLHSSTQQTTLEVIKLEQAVYYTQQDISSGKALNNLLFVSIANMTKCITLLCIHAQSDKSLISLLSGASPVNTTPVSYTSPLPGSHISPVSCSHTSPVSCSHTSPVSCSHTSPAAYSDTSLVSSSPLPWVGGGIIGAVLSTAILLTVLAAVCLLRRRRKRTHSQHRM